MSSERDELIWQMAEAAHAAHFCYYQGDHARCDNCRDDRTCFELSAGFHRDDEWDWYRTAAAALEALEHATGMMFRPGNVGKKDVV